MAVQGVQIALASSSAAALAGSTIGVVRVTVRNLGSGVAYLGSSSATTGSYQLSSGDAAQTFTLMGGETLYGYSTGTPTLHVLRMNDTT